jgi:hypothetical protein
MRNIVVFGAGSAIGHACARRWAARGDRLLLVGRAPERLREAEQDLAVRAGATDRVSTFVMDARAARDPAPLLEEAMQLLGAVDVLLVAHGSLADQVQCEASVPMTVEAIEVNGLSAVTLMAAFALPMKQRGAGTIAVISSVAGDRGRASNYTYGAAKALVTTFAGGLRHRLQGSGVWVLTIKPGFVDTPMTAAITRKGALWATADQVADDIVAAVDRGGGGTLYTPWFWRWIMLVIRLIPERLFVRLPL